MEVVPMYLVRSVREIDILISSENFWWITDKTLDIKHNVPLCVGRSKGKQGYI